MVKIENNDLGFWLAVLLRAAEAVAEYWPLDLRFSISPRISRLSLRDQSSVGHIFIFLFMQTYMHYLKSAFLPSLSHSVFKWASLTFPALHKVTSHGTLQQGSASSDLFRFLRLCPFLFIIYLLLEPRPGASPAGGQGGPGEGDEVLPRGGRVVNLPRQSELISL